MCAAPAIAFDSMKVYHWWQGRECCEACDSNNWAGGLRRLVMVRVHPEIVCLIVPCLLTAFHADQWQKRRPAQKNEEDRPRTTKASGTRSAHVGTERDPMDVRGSGGKRGCPRSDPRSLCTWRRSRGDLCFCSVFVVWGEVCAHMAMMGVQRRRACPQKSRLSLCLLVEEALSKGCNQGDFNDKSSKCLNSRGNGKQIPRRECAG
jgi:hypothetical protein